MLQFFFSRFGLSFFRFLFFRVIQLNRFVHADSGFGHVFAFAMGQHREINDRSGVGTGQNNADFLDASVQNIAFVLLQVIGKDAQAAYISVADDFFRLLTRMCVVEGAVGVNAFFPVFQDCVPEHIIGVVMLMHPYQRDPAAVIILKRVFPDGTPVTAAQVIFCGPAAEVIEFGFTHLVLSFRVPIQSQKPLCPRCSSPVLPQQVLYNPPCQGRDSR